MKHLGLFPISAATLGAVSLLLTACGRPPSENAGPSSLPPLFPAGWQAAGALQAPLAALAPTYSSIHANIIMKACIACHNGPVDVAELDLTTYDSIIAHQLVVPGDPAHSDLYIQVSTGSMPEGGPALPPDEIKAIHDWIAGGAKNN
jgi:hypothetical protein